MACNAAANPPVLPAEVTLTAGAIFQLNNAKLYAPSVFLFINNNFFRKHKKRIFKNSFLEQIQI